MLLRLVSPNSNDDAMPTLVITTQADPIVFGE